MSVDAATITMPDGTEHTLPVDGHMAQLDCERSEYSVDRGLAVSPTRANLQCPGDYTGLVLEISQTNRMLPVEWAGHQFLLSRAEADTEQTILEIVNSGATRGE